MLQPITPITTISEVADCDPCTPVPESGPGSVLARVLAQPEAPSELEPHDRNVSESSSPAGE
jgi:hypothetical protein